MTDTVDWDLARKVASRISARKPHATASTWGSLEDDFLELTPVAEDLVEKETGLRSLDGVARARATDRAGWVDANLASFDRLLRPLLESFDNDDEPGRFGRITAPVSDALGPKAAAMQVGGLLGWMSGRVLGQYDLLVIEDERPEDQDWVYFVGPNIRSLEERYGFAPREFRLWIAVHECTHRAQFTGVPWLRPYFLSLVNELLEAVDPDPGRLVDTVRDLVEKKRSGGDNAVSLKDGGLGALLATDEQKLTLDKMTGLMSLLEGHGDITMDRAAKHLIPSQERFSRILSARRKSPSGVAKVVQRLTGMEAKMAQYEEGEHFVETVEAAGGRELFDLVWSGPDSLPSIDEIREPSLWIARHR
ncbi:MAG: zinc-dependent metalloprotease [Acidimicrobiales bacterium]